MPTGARSPERDLYPRVAELMRQFRSRGRETLHDRLHRLRTTLVLALQAGLAAGLAWTAAHDLLHNPSPVFAPISAVGTLAASVGQRLRRTIELIIGVAFGVAIGDALIYVLGTGPWQLGTVVTLSILTAIFLGGSVAVVIQAAASAVLIVTLSPTVSNLEFPRFVDALVGGVVALLVTTLLLPLNPLRVINRAARPALDLLADQLNETAHALRERDPGRAFQALERLRSNKDELDAFTEAISGAKETVTLSPARWHRRGALTHYAESADPIDRAMRNSGTLIRRSVTLIEDGEPIPETMPVAVDQLAEAVRALRHEFAVGKEPDHAREVALRAVCAAGRAYADGVGFSGNVVIAQIRTAASDLIKASGLEQRDANHLIRQAFGGSERPAEPAACADRAPQPPADDRTRHPPQGGP